ncbi:unnamed protein product [Fraxinus pennsylvanica]|uniref:Uncharacterized protein n=1 Tax=Fraxinus pennsylvanica TaxID=56036 RepID=A0AAD2E3C9_9LAMI|nr:unnamed protein product [Fraxinus pennsylvanica]
MQAVPLKGSMTNEVYQIKWPTNSDKESQHRRREVLVRIYGKGVDVFLFRENEIRPQSICLWDRLRNWVNEAESLTTPEEAKAFCLDVMEDEISALESPLRRIYRFTHILGHVNKIDFEHGVLNWLRKSELLNSSSPTTKFIADGNTAQYMILMAVPLKGSMTNEVYQIKWPTNSDKESQQRRREVLVRIYGKGVDVFLFRENEIRRFSNGRIEEFIRDRVGFPEKNEKGSNWVDEAESLTTPEEAKDFCLDVMEDEISALESPLRRIYPHIGLLTDFFL